MPFDAREEGELREIEVGATGVDPETVRLPCRMPSLVLTPANSEASASRARDALPPRIVANRISVVLSERFNFPCFESIAPSVEISRRRKTLQPNAFSPRSSSQYELRIHAAEISV